MLEGSIEWNRLWYGLSGHQNFEDGTSCDVTTIPVELTDHAIFHISKPSTRQGAVPTEPAQIRIRQAS